MACIMLTPLQSIVLTQLLTDMLTLSESVLRGLEVSRSEPGASYGTCGQHVPWGRDGLLPSCSPHWGWSAGCTGVCPRVQPDLE